MKLTLRVKRMLPQIFKEMDEGATEFDLRKRYSISPHLFKILKEKYEEQKHGKA